MTVLTADDLCARFSLKPYRFGLLIEDGAFPRARLIDDRTGWTAEDVEQSSFVTHPEKWRHKIIETFGPSCVYFLAINEFIKIGFTRDLAQRLNQFRAMVPYDVELLHTVPGDDRLEKYLHAKFAAHRHRGEWFKRSQALILYIEAHKNGTGTLL